jgi:hypothetical protein
VNIFGEGYNKFPKTNWNFFVAFSEYVNFNFLPLIWTKRKITLARPINFGTSQNDLRLTKGQGM